MNDRDGTVQKRKLNGDKVEVSPWVMVVTYCLCWGFGIALIVEQLAGAISYRPLLVALGLYLIFWPVFQTNPVELVKRVFPG